MYRRMSEVKGHSVRGHSASAIHEMDDVISITPNFIATTKKETLGWGFGVFFVFCFGWFLS